MAYDEVLAHRIRELMADEDGLSEKAMFGGLAFLMHGRMVVAASRHGGLMARVDPATSDKDVARPHAQRMVMRGREMEGWALVAAEGLKTRRQLGAWIARSVAYVETLPIKPGR